MKVTDDGKTDTLGIVLKNGVPVAARDDEKSGVVLDFEGQGPLVSLEVVDVSERIAEARRPGYRTPE